MKTKQLKTWHQIHLYVKDNTKQINKNKKKDSMENKDTKKNGNIGKERVSLERKEKMTEKN